MNIDTDAIRRLRDHLLARAEMPRPATGRQSTDPALADAIRRRVEPFAESMYLVMMADGDADAAERKTLTGALDVLTDSRIDQSELEAMLGRFEANARREGSEARLAYIGARLSSDRDDREMAFTLSAVVAMADNRIDVRENQMLEWVSEYCGISERRVAALLEAIDPPSA
jgi:uncharacterized tellurite resistance protein B-like protein